MCEGVTIHNLKTDSKSEYGGPNTAEEREQRARKARLAIDQPLVATCATRGEQSSAHVCHTQSTCGADMASFGWLISSLSLIPFKYSNSLTFHFHEEKE